MSLYESYQQFIKKQLTVEEFAERLHITPLSLRLRMSKWGDGFGSMLVTLDRLGNEELDSSEAAAILDCSVRQVNKLREAYGVGRVLREYRVTRTASQIRWEVNKTFALNYIAGRCNIERAAADAHMSERNMRRWVSRLLANHSNLTYKEHSKLSLAAMQRVAKEVEEKENISIQTQMVADAISSGQKTIREEAVQRALFLRKRRKRNAED